MSRSSVQHKLTKAVLCDTCSLTPLIKCCSLQALLGAALLSLSGCGGASHPPTVAVAGNVTFNGAPLNNGTIRFNPVDPKNGRPAEGKIGSDGKFSLSTFEAGDGAMAGDYSVTVIPMEDVGGKLAKDSIPAPTDKSAIPKKYSDPKTSGLKETIKAGERKTDLKIELDE